MKVAYTCTNYNNSADTITAIESLRSGDGKNCLVVVVDNASGADEVTLIREFCDSDALAELVALENNVGYFSGLNVGLSRVRELRADADVVVIGNNDLIFPEDFIATVERAAGKFEQYAVVSPNIVTLEGEHQNPHVIHGVSNFRERVFDLVYSSYWLALLIRTAAAILHRFTRRGDENNHETAMEVSQGHGSCYLLGKRFFSDYGNLWAPTFLFGEEYFLSLQLEKNGERVFYEPSIFVTHAWHSSLSKIPSRKQWEFGRDAHVIYRKHNPIGRDAKN